MKRVPKRILAGAFLLLSLIGCHRRIVPESMTATAGIPRIGWVIMAGDRDNPDDQFVCQSQPRNDCVLPPSRPDHQTYTDVHFYFHPAAADTKYTGTIQVGFVQGAAPLTPNVTVKAGDAPTQSSIFGPIVSNPGRHVMVISLVAEGAQRREIREQVQIQLQ